MATDQVVDGASCKNTMQSSSSTTSSSSSPTSSAVTSPENTLHKYQTLPSHDHDLSESISPPASAPSPAPAAATTTTTTECFQVTSGADAKVGRFSVTSAGKEDACPKEEEDVCVPSVAIVQPNSQCLLSSDDSEPEDEAFKKEIRQLKERWDLFKK